MSLLRQSDATPNVSTYAHMYCNFDYNRIPLAPAIAKARIFTHKRGTTCSHQVNIIAFITNSCTILDQKDCQLQSSSSTNSSNNQSHRSSHQSYDSTYPLNKRYDKGYNKGSKKEWDQHVRPPTIGRSNKTYQNTTIWHSRPSSAK